MSESDVGPDEPEHAPCSNDVFSDSFISLMDHRFRSLTSTEPDTEATRATLTGPSSALSGSGLSQPLSKSR
jgi:hypothetical protein